MAKKIKKTQSVQIKKAPENEPMPRKKKIAIISVTSVVAAILVVAFIIGLIAILNKNRSVDYLNDDLSKYVYISEEDYKNYPVSVPLVTVDESDVMREVRKLLVKNKDKNALFGGAAVHKPGYAITLGDVAYLWYRGYTVAENGAKTELRGACNFGDGKPYALEIGSGTFIKGIEEALVGKKLQSESVKVVKNGVTLPGDVIYISYNLILGDGSTESKSGVRIETANKAAVDKIFGTGFTNFLTDKTISEVAGSNKAFSVIGEDVDRVYYDITIDYVVRTEAEPYVIDVVFPADYHEESYRGLAASFEVYVSTAEIYNTPEWSDAFVTETLKETAESLAAYKGETLTEKYQDKLLLELTAKAEEKNSSLIEEEMWKHYHQNVTVKRLPEKEVKAIYRQYFNEVQNQYTAYGAGYESFDAFARYYFGLSKLENWRDYITKKAEKAVTERLLFYYILDKENLIPTDEIYEEIFAEYRAEYMEYYKELYKTELDACKTEEEKEKKLLELEARMINYYGEEYFRELVYYQYAMEKLVEYADIKK